MQNITARFQGLVDVDFFQYLFSPREIVGRLLLALQVLDWSLVLKQESWLS